MAESKTKPKPKPGAKPKLAAAPAPISENSASQNRVNTYNKILYGGDHSHDIPFTDPPIAPDTPGTGGDQSGTTGFDPLALASDWYKAFFNSYGLPGDVQSEIMRILRTYAADPSTAQALSQQYLRTTDWFSKTYPGFNQGVTNGLFTDETGYRGYLNQVNQTFNQYLNRHVTGEEVSGYLASGYNPGYVGSLLQGQAWSRANADQVRYLSGAFGDEGRINEKDLTTLGQQHAGIDTGRGQTLDVLVSRAQQRLQSIFQGSLARPSMGFGPAGLAAPSLGGTRQTPDVGA